MTTSSRLILTLAVLLGTCRGNVSSANDAEVGVVKANSRGLHGYIGYSASRPSDRATYSAGMGFYSAVWPLIDKPIAHFQIGLPSAWITPDNSDNKDKPLAPIGTHARDHWPERGPTWGSVFQTVEGGLGYWAGNHFRYGPPKFSMNATPQCYDYEVGSPGWSFFYSNEALPDDRLGIAQLSNRLLIPPDALPFEGNPNGKFLGYTYMALPFTEPTTGDPPTGDQAWTCFLSAANFKGPMAYYIPETWSKTGKLFNYPFIYGRGLDARPGRMGGGAMEINTVPRFESKDAKGVTYSKLPRLQFPVDDKGRTLLVQDVTYYSRAALYDAFKAWRNGGPTCSGRFDEKGAWKSKLTTRTPRFDQGGKKITGVEKVFDTKIFEGNVWGLEWRDGTAGANGCFPQYSKHVADERVAVSAADVPAETKLLTAEFRLAGRGQPYTSPTGGAWGTPGPARGPYKVDLADGSTVTYSWYRFVDQPSFQQYKWSDAKKAKLQSFVEKIHAHWPIDRDYMPPPTSGKPAALDPALLVTPPAGLEVGYVPIVTYQEDTDLYGLAGKTHSAVTPLRQRDDFPPGRWTPRHEKILERVAQGNVDLIFVGDSITHGWERSGKELWNKYYGSRNAVNMGVIGDRTQQVLWRLDNGEIDGISPKLAVLMIGTNNCTARNEKYNTAEEIADGIKAICAKIRYKLPRTKILMLAVFPRGAHSDPERNPERVKNAKASRLASEIADNDMIYYLNINDKFLDANGTLPTDAMPDRCHPNEKGYKIWADAIEPVVAKLMCE